MTTTSEVFYPESLFGGFTDVDGTVAFYSRVNALLETSSIAVDFGCGRGRHVEDPVAFRRNITCLRGKANRVIGLDVDKSAAVNPTIDEFHLLTSGSGWPLPDESVHLIVSDSVVEHLASPSLFFAEAKRTLVPGGCLCIRTPNVFSYVGVASMLLPNRWHARLVASVQSERKEEDVFPTLYKCNTTFALRRQMKSAGFDAVVYGHGTEPRYLNFSKAAYAIGVLHQKLAPGVVCPELFAFGRRI